MEKPNLDYTQSEMRHNSEAERQWHNILTSLTHEHGAFYWDLHPYFITKLDSTAGPLLALNTVYFSGTLRQRLRVKTSILQHHKIPMLSPPFLNSTYLFKYVKR